MTQQPIDKKVLNCDMSQMTPRMICLMLGCLTCTIGIAGEPIGFIIGGLLIVGAIFVLKDEPWD